MSLLNKRANMRHLPRHRRIRPGFTTCRRMSKRLASEGATSSLWLAINDTQKRPHGTVEIASSLLVRLHRPRWNSKEALKFLSRGCNFRTNGLYLGGRYDAPRQLMRLQLDFAAQVFGHLVESLDKIISDTRAHST